MKDPNHSPLTPHPSRMQAEAGAHRVMQSRGNPDVFLWARPDSMLEHDNIDQVGIEAFLCMVYGACPG